MSFAGPANPADAADWLRLIRSDNVGPATFFALLSRFGSAAAALAALPAIAERGGARRPIRCAGAGEVEREMARAARLDARHIFFGTADYPARLSHIHAPPPVIMVRGEAGVLSRRPLAIVGARKASAAGRTLAGNFAAAFGTAGRVVVSGLALGIDTAAHRGALSTGTVAVVAGGVDRPTPEDNIPLAEEIIAAGGAVVSEMPLGMMPYARDYPRRNRLISGLSDAVVVVEAAQRSGALHTARFAGNENREVFALPGSPLDPRAAGCLQLLREGATLAVDPRDVLDAVADWAAPGPPAGLAEPAAPAMTEPGAAVIAAVAEALSLSPVSVDLLARATGLAPGAVAAAVVELEVAGRAHRELDGTVRAALDG
ncbi:MAG: DNA-processing protein DprA [Acuticoccus sp.]